MANSPGANGFKVLPEIFWKRNLTKLGKTCSIYLSDLMEDANDFSWYGAKAG